MPDASLETKDLIEKGHLKKLIDYGTDMAGSLAGAATGFLFAGPEGAVIGAAAGSLIHNVGNDIAHRLLSEREKVRVGAVIIFATNNIKEKLDKGMQLRQDNFFSQQPGRSSAEEICEGVLLAAQREYEEKKLPLYGHLLANIAFSPGVARAHANLLLKLSQELSYRQLGLLALFATDQKSRLRQENYHNSTTMNVAIVAVPHEVFDLEKRGLISSGIAVLGITDLVPAKMYLEGQGELLFKLMHLWSIKTEDLNDIFVLLQ
jgi:hypothetical protein